MFVYERRRHDTGHLPSSDRCLFIALLASNDAVWYRLKIAGLTYVMLWNSSDFQPEIEKLSFYRAMHFSAKRGIAIACRLSVCLSVCL